MSEESKELNWLKMPQKDAVRLLVQDLNEEVMAQAGKWRANHQAVLNGTDSAGLPSLIILQMRFHTFCREYGSTQACLRLPRDGSPENEKRHMNIVKREGKRIAERIALKLSLRAACKCKKHYELKNHRLGIDPLPECNCTKGTSVRLEEALEGQGSPVNFSSPLFKEDLRPRGKQKKSTAIWLLGRAGVEIEQIAEAYCNRQAQGAASILRKRMRPRTFTPKGTEIPNLKMPQGIAYIHQEDISPRFRDPEKPGEIICISANPVESCPEGLNHGPGLHIPWELSDSWEQLRTGSSENRLSFTMRETARGPGRIEKGSLPGVDPGNGEEPEGRRNRKDGKKAGKGNECCWLHSVEALQEIENQSVAIGAESAKLLLNYRKRLEKQPRITRLLRSGIPDEDRTFLWMRGLAETERRTQFAENHPGQATAGADLRTRTRPNAKQRMLAFLEEVDRNARKRDPAEPVHSSKENTRAFLEMKIHRETLQENRPIPHLRETLIKNFGSTRFRGLYQKSPEGAFLMIEIMKRAARNRNSGEALQPYKDKLIGHTFNKLSDEELLDEAGELRKPFWTSGPGKHQFSQIDECLHDFISMLTKLTNPKQHGQGDNFEEDMKEAKEQLSLEECRPQRIRRWVESWHDIQNDPSRRLQSGDGYLVWERPPGWEDWEKCKEGGLLYPGLKPVTDSRDLEVLGDVNCHCIRTYQAAVNYHIFTHPMEGNEPVTDLSIPCAISVIHIQSSGYQASQNLAKSNEQIPRSHESWKAVQALAAFMNRKKYGKPKNRNVEEEGTKSEMERVEEILFHYENHLRKILPKRLCKIFEKRADESPYVKSVREAQAQAQAQESQTR